MNTLVQGGIPFDDLKTAFCVGKLTLLESTDASTGKTMQLVCVTRLGGDMFFLAPINTIIEQHNELTPAT